MGYTVTERQPDGNHARYWTAFASDAPGTNLIAVVNGSDGYNGYVWVSADGGANWTKRNPASASQYWMSVASDADGSNLVVAAAAGDIYTSANYGATWTKRQPTGGIQNWNFVCSDDNGSNLMAGASSGRLWTSADGGANWTERRPAGNYNKDWRCGACNADGSILIAGDYTPGRLWQSVNSGADWAELRPAGNYNESWCGIACDADASNLIAADELRLYTSSDSGTNWTERQPIGNVDMGWRNVASDNDGSNLIAEDEARIYTSGNGGATWIEQQPAGDMDGFWGLCSNGDGSLLLVGESYYKQRLYTLTRYGLIWTQRTMPASATWTSVAYGNETFVAIAYDTDVAATSSNGIDWVQRTMPASAYWRSIAFGNGVFVAVSGNGGIVATSTDGIDWDEHILPKYDAGEGNIVVPWNDVAYGEGRFIAIAPLGIATSLVAVSIDGASWTYYEMKDDGVPLVGFGRLCFGDGKWVAAAAPDVAISADHGQTWTTYDGEAGCQWERIMYTRDRFMLTGQKNAGLTDVTKTSTTGTSWTDIVVPMTGVWSTKRWYGSYGAAGYNFFVCTNTYSLSATSVDGVTWDWQEFPTTGTWMSVTWGNDLFVAVVEANAAFCATAIYVPPIASAQVISAYRCIVAAIVHSFPWVGKFQLSHVP